MIKEKMQAIKQKYEENKKTIWYTAAIGGLAITAIGGIAFVTHAIKKGSSKNRNSPSSVMFDTMRNWQNVLDSPIAKFDIPEIQGAKDVDVWTEIIGGYTMSEMKLDHISDIGDVMSKIVEIAKTGSEVTENTPAWILVEFGKEAKEVTKD